MAAEHLRRMYDYDLWANQQVLASVRKASERGESLRLFSHILAAYEVWLTRLRAEDSVAMAIWPERTLEDCEAHTERLAGEIQAYLAEATLESLGREVTYRNQTGKEFRHTPMDILTHVALHGQHHRGQIIWELRRLGQEASSTDMILYLRR